LFVAFKNPHIRVQRIKLLRLLTCVKMSNTSQIPLEIHHWRNELLPLSQESIVREMSVRFEPIFTRLLDKIETLEKQIKELQENKIHE